MVILLWSRLIECIKTECIETWLKMFETSSSQVIDWEHLRVQGPGEVGHARFSTFPSEAICRERGNKLGVAYNCDFLISLDRVRCQEISTDLLGELTTCKDGVFGLKCAIRQLSDHQIKHDLLNVGVGCPALHLSKSGVECVFPVLPCHRVKVPKLGLFHAGDPSEVKVETVADGLPRGVLLDQLVRIHVHVVASVHDLVDHWLDDEAELCQVGVILEHVDCCLHGSLHR